MGGRSPLPLSELVARALENPQANRRDHAGILGERDEIDRIDEAALGMLPANQCFEAGELAVLKRNDRLIVNAELFAIECAPQVVLHLQQINRVRMHSFIEYS